MAIRKRNRAAQDTTLINLRALQKRVKALEGSVAMLKQMVRTMARRRW